MDIFYQVKTKLEISCEGKEMVSLLNVFNIVIMYNINTQM